MKTNALSKLIDICAYSNICFVKMCMHICFATSTLRKNVCAQVFQRKFALQIFN